MLRAAAIQNGVWYRRPSHPPTPKHAPTPQVTVTHEGKKVELEVPAGKTILEVALDKGIHLPHDCKLGVRTAGSGCAGVDGSAVFVGVGWSLAVSVGIGWSLYTKQQRGTPPLFDLQPSSRYPAPVASRRSSPARCA